MVIWVRGGPVGSYSRLQHLASQGSDTSQNGQELSPTHQQKLPQNRWSSHGIRSCGCTSSTGMLIRSGICSQSRDPSGKARGEPKQNTFAVVYMLKCSIFQTLPTYQSLQLFQNSKIADLHLGFIFCYMTLLVQPMQLPLQQPLRGWPTGPIYVTLVESTLFDGSMTLSILTTDE